ncbi:Protoheme IX farnesyltransferase [Candidatus Methylomirabilis lanthanidiphila]|uniref:Protoheme IX farnesyltransferase n=1 Tax=Candidatus Methylomirabilis lanthanidiphila TaxID=2211376 RepID=A0A564ZFW2_9BACT|nr:UbiA family prenyltransferase [Candidatus Methylomirabilis lanthanidiphila]VUZ84210.1 Protoheme IX farnesyltransferase [Candidatus Methylomirabilis lanthanidiphila]
MGNRICVRRSGHHNKMAAPWAKLCAIVDTAHPRAVVVFTLVTLAVAIISEHGLPPLRFTVTLVLAMALVQISVGVFNEYCDRDLDAIAKPSRVMS